MNFVRLKRCSSSNNHRKVRWIKNLSFTYFFNLCLYSRTVNFPQYQGDNEREKFQNWKKFPTRLEASPQQFFSSRGAQKKTRGGLFVFIVCASKVRDFRCKDSELFSNQFTQKKERSEAWRAKINFLLIKKIHANGLFKMLKNIAFYSLCTHLKFIRCY